jgi:hypothetical protein
VSLSRALSTLSPDEYTEQILRDILTLFSHNPREWLSEADIRLKTGRTATDIHGILEVLSTSYVLERDDTGQRYQYSGDVVLKFEIDSFMRRVDHHQSHVRSNVARFRERQGY